MKAATDIMRGVSTTQHHQAFVNYLQPLIHAGIIVTLVLDGDRWPLKSKTHTERRNKRGAALEKAEEAWKLGDYTAADKYYKQAVQARSLAPAWQHVRRVRGSRAR